MAFLENTSTIKSKEKMKNKYCALVVLYNPDIQTVSNLKYIKESHLPLIAVDNTPNPNVNCIKIKKISNRYITNGENIGLARALYSGCEEAIKENYDYVLTLDQDTVVPLDTIKKLIERAELSEDDNVAIICPEVYAFSKDNKIENTYPVYTCEQEEECSWVMTSGSLMSLMWYSKVGKFDEKLFIDHIDIDIGMKIHEYGGKIMRQPDAPVYQHLGHSEERKFLWKTIHPMFDSPMRTYYVARNQYYLVEKYGRKFWKFSNVSYTKMLIKIVFYETNKMDKLKMFFRGIQDAKKHKLGELEEV